MNPPLRKVVFDCNVYLQALGNPHGPAGKCVQAALDGRLQLFIDQELIDEMVEVSARPELIRKLRILPTRVSELLDELNARTIFIEDPPTIFQYERDPDDAHYVNLAIAAQAYLIVSRDKDLLDLMNDGNAEGKALRDRFPSFRVLTPPMMLSILA